MSFILGVTLARGGSKSILKKNIVKINGTPLIAYTIQEARKSPLIDNYIVNTDCPEICKVAEKHGAEVQFGRPNELCSDTAQSGDTLKYVVERFETERKIKVDIVVEIMATNPLKIVFDIDSCIKLFIDS